MLSPLHLDIALPQHVTQVTRSRYFHNLWLPVQVSRRDPQPHFPLHNHDFDEVAYILKGHGVSFMEGSFRLLLPGNITYLRASDTHAYPMVDSLHLLNLFFDHERLIKNFPKIGSLIEDFHALQANRSQLFTDYTAYTRLRALADLLDMETYHSDDYSEHAAMAYLVEFFVLVLRQYQRSESYKLKDPDEQVRDKLLKIFEAPQLTEAKGRKDLEALIAIHDLSWRSFERSLSEMAGLTPHGLCICNRFIAFLNSLIRQPNRSLDDASEAAGFSDYRSMSRNCRQFLQMTPKDVRDRIKRFVTTPPQTSPLGNVPSDSQNTRPRSAYLKALDHMPATR
ncbi:helix-turn-helix transcriptional regulator [uncultured Cohaesibacter sp.]|uniref:AraC family transcriptional regulator n=1 Tax=uncultured Cohaesibacter sp. TaxID=1002546 RepID=UPI002931556C|nr:helix-turn-helix transcriptional regulator [uncultured Cohaesibacter sp.]